MHTTNTWIKRSWILGIVIGFTAHAQDQPYTFKVHTDLRFPLTNVFDPAVVDHAPDGIYHIAKAFPQPISPSHVVKEKVNALRAIEGVHYGMKSLERRNNIDPIVSRGFSGAVSGGIPNDNNIAVSKSGWVVSVLNTNIRIYNDTGRWYKNWSLEFFPRAIEQTAPGSGVGVLDRSYDPKIVYDPEAERFIIVYLEGSESSDTRIITAFSKSDNPLDGWFVYQLDGNPFKEKTWSDYPIIGISKEDLYITVNILKDSTDWRDGFTQSVIWQVPKSYGYNGDSLRANLLSDIVYDGKPVWSICAIPGGLELFGKGMFFLSVRPGDEENDTVFLHRINTNFSEGAIQYSLKVLKTNLSYGLPPDAYQPEEGFRLQSNDARVLSGFVHAGKIQYVQTSRNRQSNRSAIYHGIIADIYSNPSVKGTIIGHDSMDLAYPSIAYAGDGAWNHNALITCSHASETHFPGTSVVYVDNAGIVGKVKRIKEGEGLINTFLPNDRERWGDYTGIQRDYNQLGVFWTVGSFGNSLNRMDTWVNRVVINDRNVGLDLPPIKESSLQVFPNPAKDHLQLVFYTQQPGAIQVNIYDINGKLVMTEKRDNPYSGQFIAHLSLKQLSSGIYTYQIVQSTHSPLLSGKFLIE